MWSRFPTIQSLGVFKVELLALDYPVTTPREFVEGWDSLVWTLRYQRPGEFKLTTSLVEETMRQLPIDSMCAINEGEEIMMVDTHVITTDAKGKSVLTVSGESFQGFMRYRIAGDTYEYLNNKRLDANGAIVDAEAHSWLIGGNPWNNADAANYIMTEHLLNGPYSFVGGAFKPEILPNLKIYQTDPAGRIEYANFVKRENLLTAVERLLIAGGNGLRSKRALASSNDSEFIIYRGVDRSLESADPVIFRQEDGHFKTAKYLMSKRGYYNAFRIYPAKRTVSHYWAPDHPNGPHPFTRMGIFHRDLSIDATEISADDQASYDAGVYNRLVTEINNNAPTYVMECTVAENIPYVYGTEYNLGDILTLVGDFGIVKNARVDEYVMTEDKNGVRASPGLTIFQ